MLIYGDSADIPYGGVESYKSAHKRKRSSIRVKALKRGRQKKRQHSVSKKVKRSKKRRRARKVKKLNVKNLKFLKKLGFRVKKH